MKIKLKFFYFIFAIAIVSLLSSCGNDDDDSPNNTSPIVGTWTYSDSELTFLIDDQGIAEFLIANGEDPLVANALENLIKSEFEDVLDLQGTSFVFNADGTFSVRENGAVQESGTYQLNSNNTKLTITSSEGPQEFDVEELTNNKLSLSFSEEEMEDFNDDGTLNTIFIKILFDFVK
jgi:hypothetical protein